MSKFFLVFFLVLSSLASLPGFAQSGMPAAEASQVININTADAATLASSLNGVGLARANAIVRYREQYGPFDSVDELAEVTGIGPAILANNRHLITVE